MSRLDDLFERFRGRVPYYLMKDCVENDPTPNNKYVPYLLNVFSINPSVNPDQVFLAVRKFYELLPYINNTDIHDKFYLKGNNMLKVIEAAEIKKKKSFDKKIKGKDVTIVKETDRYILLQPHTHEASMKYGANTTWCTTERSSPETFFKYYTGYLCYLISKVQRKKNYSKLALHVTKTPVIGKYMFGYDVYDQLDVLLPVFPPWDATELKEIDQAYRDFVNETEMPIPPSGVDDSPYDIGRIIVPHPSMTRQEFEIETDPRGYESRERSDRYITLSEAMETQRIKITPPNTFLSDNNLF